MADSSLHATYLDAAIKIIESDKFILGEIEPEITSKTRQIAQIEETILNFNYFMSLARNFQSVFVQKLLNKIWSIKVVFEFNNNLNNNYKIIPYNYFYKTDIFYGEKIASKNELEERLLSNKETIDNATKYIKKIYITIPKVYAESALRGRPGESFASDGFFLLDKFLDLIYKKGIPVEFFINEDRAINITKRLFYDKEKAKEELLKLAEEMEEGFLKKLDGEQLGDFSRGDFKSIVIRLFRDR
jgi:hypothetical protein